MPDSALGCVSTEDQSFSNAECKAIVRTLDAILNSPQFCNAQRSSRFLSYIVQRSLAGESELLKERTIGIDVFDRRPDYSTGEDAIVRVQAVDLRRRLARFYHSELGSNLEARITLPGGTYVPKIEFCPAPTETVQSLSGNESTESKETTADVPKVSAGPARLYFRYRYLVVAFVLTFSVLAGLAPLKRLIESHRSDAYLREFWRPAFSSSRPIVIGLAKAVTYRPTKQFFQEYAKTHPGTFEKEWQRVEQNPFGRVDVPGAVTMHESEAYGVATGDVYASAQISTLFSRLGKNSQLLIGEECTYETLRQSPSVLLGAFNNRWTFELAGHPPFQFEEEPLRIVEASGKHRVWVRTIGVGGEGNDYGLVLRIPNAQTGQFVVILAGIGTYGTEAATELVANGGSLHSVLASLGADWSKHNLALVVRTTTIDRVAGPPTVIAAQLW